jgi:hypothetical protein
MKLLHHLELTKRMSTSTRIFTLVGKEARNSRDSLFSRKKLTKLQHQAHMSPRSAQDLNSPTKEVKKEEREAQGLD